MYAGYGLSAAVDILCGVMSGAYFATHVRKWTLDGSTDGPANLGQVFIAVDPGCFAPGFDDRMSEFNGILRGLPPVSSFLEWNFHASNASIQN